MQLLGRALWKRRGMNGVRFGGVINDGDVLMRVNRRHTQEPGTDVERLEEL